MNKDEKFFWVIQRGMQWESYYETFIGTMEDLLAICGHIHIVKDLLQGTKPLRCWDSTFTYRRDMVKEALKSITLDTPPTKRTLRAEQDDMYREMDAQMTRAETEEDRDHQKLLRDQSRGIRAT